MTDSEKEKVKLCVADIDGIANALVARVATVPPAAATARLDRELWRMRRPGSGRR